MLNPQASTSESYTPYSESPLGYSLTATPEHQSEEIHSEDLYPIEKSGSEPEADSDSSPECCGCFSKSKKKQGRNRSKRSIGKLFFENHKRQKRMMGQGSSRGKEHPEQLTITDCGHWLATMWFGVNFMLFILGWMLLSFQYYPMYI
uniref:Uncharacterized protein n=1 Tax=Meloidogyne hapla TaxID=6305 RepID=A0A1I8BAY2_MELHA